MDYESIRELVSAAEESGVSIGEAVLRDQAAELELSREETYARMEERLRVMESAAQQGMDKDLRSTSGLTGGDAWKMMQSSGGVMGGFLQKTVARALAVSEFNAAMGRIVAAPTAGSCGIMPGCLLTLMAEKQVEREKIVLSLFTAAAFGMVIAAKASVAGAQGGCQAECGSAAGMTAAALAEAMGGTPQMAAEACAIALKNQLGLVCDPVAGLVEVPCVKRNAVGAVIACAAADMALAGISSRIPADEVIGAMKEIGDALPKSLKETAGGGLAATPTGLRLKEEIFGRG